MLPTITRRPLWLAAAATGAVVLLGAAAALAFTGRPATPPPIAMSGPPTAPAGPRVPDPPHATESDDVTISPSLAAALHMNPAGVHATAGPGELLTWAAAGISTSGMTGLISSPNGDATNTTESMIKTWIVGDYLRQHTMMTAARLDEAHRAIVNSDDQAAQDLYQVGGADLVIGRMVADCHLTATTLVHAWWSRTVMSATDAVRLGVCIANGTAAGPKWTPWLLRQMGKVAGKVTDQHPTYGGGRWGIIDAIPAGHDVAIKNGWTLRPDGQWHVNCLAIIDDQWVLAILTSYPAARGLTYGATQCAAVTRELIHA